MWRSIRAAGVLTALAASRQITLADATVPASLHYTPGAITGAGISHSSLQPSQETAGGTDAVEITKRAVHGSSSSSSSSPGQHGPAHQQSSRIKQSLSSTQQRPPPVKEGTHFAVFTGDGRPSRLTSIVAAMQHVDVAILGEYHDDPVAHVLQLELLKRTAKALGHQAPAPTPAAADAMRAAVAAGPATAAQQPAAANQPGQQQDIVVPGMARPAQQLPEQQQHQQQQQQQQRPLSPQPAQQHHSQDALLQQAAVQQAPAVQRPLVLSLEMFERDVQLLLDEYLAGTATLADLLRDSRPWPNFRTDYQPLVDFCKALASANKAACCHSGTASLSAPTAGSASGSTPGMDAACAGGDSKTGGSSNHSSSTGDGSFGSCVRVVAANAPRRYVSLAGRSGREALLGLPAASQAFLAPLPYAQPSQAYVDKVQSSMRQAAAEMQRHRLNEQQQQQQQEQRQEQRQVEQRQGQEEEGSQLQQQQQQQQEKLVNQHQHVQEGVAAAHKLRQGGTAAQGEAEAAAPQAQGAVSSAAAAAATVTEPADSVPASSSSGATPGVGGRGACPYIGFNVSTNFLDAQCLWDSTMAYSIAEHLVGQQTLCRNSSRPSPGTPAAGAAGPARMARLTDADASAAGAGAPAAPLRASRPLVIHVCGKFHAESGLGVPEHLQLYAPGSRVLVVVFVPNDSMALSAEEFKQAGLQGLADFVVLTDSGLPRSFAFVHPV